MRICTFVTVILAGLLFTLPLAAQDAKKKSDSIGDILGGAKKNDTKDKKGSKKAKKDHSLKKDVLPWRKLFSFPGKVMKAEAGKFTIQVTYNIQVPVADAPRRALQYQQQLARWKFNLARQLASAQRQTNPFQRARSFAQYQNSLRNMPRPPQLTQPKTITKDVEIRTGAKLIVRTATPDLQYDEKGNIVRLTPKKLKKLAGPEGYPGFPATLSDVSSNSTVRVYLARRKNPKSKKKKSPNIADILGTTANSKGGDQEPAVDPNIPEALMIVVMPNNQFKQ